MLLYYSESSPCLYISQGKRQNPSQVYTAQYDFAALLFFLLPCTSSTSYVLLDFLLHDMNHYLVYYVIYLFIFYLHFYNLLFFIWSLSTEMHASWGQGFLSFLSYIDKLFTAKHRVSIQWTLVVWMNDYREWGGGSAKKVSFKKMSTKIDNTNKKFCDYRIF